MLSKERAHLGYELLLSILLKYHILVLFDNCKTLIEDLSSILLAHEGLEFGELAGRDVNHLLFADVACDARILSFIIDRGSLRTHSLCCTNCWINVIRLHQALDVILVAVVADVRDVPRTSDWRLRVHRFAVFIVARRSQVRLILLVLVVEEGRVVVLLHELLRWLVDIHCCHLLLCLPGLLLSSLSLCLSLGLGLSLRFFLLLCCSLISLNLLELLEDILVMQQSMRELVPEGITLEEPLDSALNHRNLEQLVYGWSLGGVSLEHTCHDIRDSR